MGAELGPALAGGAKAAGAVGADELVCRGAEATAQDYGTVGAGGSKPTPSRAVARAAGESFDGSGDSLVLALGAHWFGAPTVHCGSVSLLFAVITVGYSGAVRTYYWRIGWVG